jgi:hypothetical protein
MIICACCNPPKVDVVENGIFVPDDFPSHYSEGWFRITPEGIEKLKEAGFAFKRLDWVRLFYWHTPEGKPIEGIVHLEK